MVILILVLILVLILQAIQEGLDGGISKRSVREIWQEAERRSKA